MSITCDLPGCSRPCHPPHFYCCREHALEADLLSGGVAADDEQPAFEQLQALQARSGDVSTGLSAEDAEKLPRKRVRIASRVKRSRGTRAAAQLVLADGADCCAICLVEWEDADEAIVLPSCEHAFHADCVLPWLKDKSTCPTCKRDVLEEMAKQ